MNKDVLLIGGGAALLLYFFMSKGTTAAGALPAGVPATATQFVGVGGGTAANPAKGDVYTDANGNVVAVYGALNSAGAPWIAIPAGTSLPLSQYKQYGLNPAPGNSAGSPITPPPPVAVTPPAPPAATTSTFNLAQIAANIQSQSAADPAVSGGSATPWVWNYYLQQPNVSGGLVTANNVPDLSVVFPGVDPTQPMAFTNYWNGMSKYLASSRGLSGFGFMPRSQHFNTRMGGWMA